MQKVLGREKKKESLLAGMGHKEVASENVDKAISVDVNNQENWTKQCQQCLQKICVRHYVRSLS